MDKIQVAKYFDVEAEAVLKVREVDGGATIRALIDYGIGGVKVFQVPVKDFEPPKAKPVSLPVAYDLNEELVSYKELQELAKDAGIPANWSAARIRAALEEEE
jgi:hypothetical protein